MTCFLGADIGTTNVKILAMSTEGHLLAQSSEALRTVQPRPGYSEQIPDDVLTAFFKVLNEVCQQLEQQGLRPEVLSFSAAMHSLMAVDATGKPLTNAILWSDNRSEKQVEKLKKKDPAFVKQLYRQTTIPLHPMTPFSKLLWFCEKGRGIHGKAAKWLSLKEYIWLSLTGNYQLDYSLASATGLFDTRRLNWYAPALERVHVSQEQLSELVPTTYITTYEGYANARTSLPVGVQLVAGASDGCLANLGAGAIEPGITTITIGTSGAVRQTLNRPLIDVQGRLFSYILDTDPKQPCYIVGGPTNNGGNVLQWLSEQVAAGSVADVLKTAATVRPGSDELLFLPYLQGERAPLWNAQARGAYLNVNWQHTKAHFVRAALEGVLFNIRAIENLLARQVGPTQVIHANGGFAHSALWVQMLADIFGVQVRLNDSNESGCIGSVLLAMKATGHVSSLTEACRMVGFGQTFEPDAENHAVYKEAFKRFLFFVENGAAVGIAGR